MPRVHAPVAGGPQVPGTYGQTPFFAPLARGFDSTQNTQELEEGDQRNTPRRPRRSAPASTGTRLRHEVRSDSDVGDYQSFRENYIEAQLSYLSRIARRAAPTGRLLGVMTACAYREVFGICCAWMISATGFNWLRTTCDVGEFVHGNRR